MQSKTAVYPGSFDPVTYGHIDVIERALKLFDKLIILVGDNPQKKTLFDSRERVQILKGVFKNYNGVEVGHFEGLLLDFMKKKNLKVIIRGLRAVSDFEFEFQRALLNRELDGDIETIFIMTKDKYSFLNSSIVKEIAMFKGQVSLFVPPAVEKKLREKFGN